MTLPLTQAHIERLRAYLDACSDAEMLKKDEYVCDFYDTDPPFSINLTLLSDGAQVDGAAVLRFDEEMNGWYIAERIEEADRVRSLLIQAGALQ